MAGPLLSTKLHTPVVRPHLVRRSRLIARLDDGLRCTHSLTLILHHSDNDLSRFLAYLLAALHGILAKIRNLNVTLVSVIRIE